MQATLDRVGVRGNTSDLEAQPFYTWIKKTYPWHVVGQLAGLFLFGGLPALVWAGALRIAWVYHITWFVNSASHVWGRQSYNTGVSQPHSIYCCPTCCLDNDSSEPSGCQRKWCDAGRVMGIPQPQIAKGVSMHAFACPCLPIPLLQQAYNSLEFILLALSIVYRAFSSCIALHCKSQATSLICGLAGCCVPCQHVLCFWLIPPGKHCKQWLARWDGLPQCGTFPQHNIGLSVAGDLSRNNWWVAILAFGEGWHNNHHAFEFSARHGLKWWQFDTTWMVISFFKALGLADNVKLPTDKQKARLAI